MESTSYDVDSSKDETKNEGRSEDVTPNKQTTTNADVTMADDE